MLAPTIICFGADLTSTHGTGKPVFSVAHSHCADAFIAVSRSDGAEKTATRGTDKSVPYKRPVVAAES